VHIIIAPGLDDAGGAASAYGSNGIGPIAMPAADAFATRLEPGVGYNVELRVPWSTLGQPAPTLGSTVGFDVGIDLRLPPNEGGVLDYQAFHRVVPLLGTQKPNGVCPSYYWPAHPSCDDRTWCRPTLGGP
jgi:hypothetical protein